MKTIEITLDGITASIQGEAESIQTERTTHEYPGFWVTSWVYKPQILELWDEDGNDVTDITVELENRFLTIAQNRQEDFV